MFIFCVQKGPGNPSIFHPKWTVEIENERRHKNAPDILYGFR